MKIPAKIDYAARAILELALRSQAGKPVQVGDIGKKQGIPAKFLIHIMITLKSLGYVDSTRGKMGGYVLTKEPKDIKLSDVFKAFGGFGFSTTEKKIRGKKVDVIQGLWDEMDGIFIRALENVSFEEIVARHQKQLKEITFDI